MQSSSAESGAEELADSQAEERVVKFLSSREKQRLKRQTKYAIFEDSSGNGTCRYLIGNHW